MVSRMVTPAFSTIIHLVDGDPAVRSYEAEGVGADVE